MAVYKHSLVVCYGTEPTAAQVISKSFTANTNAVWQTAGVDISSDVTGSWNISVAIPGRPYKVHYVVLTDASVTYTASASYYALAGASIQSPEFRRKLDPRRRM